MTSNIEPFESAVATTIGSADAAHAERVCALTAAMEERARLHATLAQLAAWVHREEIRPRMDALARHLAGARLTHVRNSVGIASTCVLPRSDRFPASTTLTVGIGLGIDCMSASVSYRVDIIPLLMELDGRDQLDIDPVAPDHGTIGAWLERKLLAFVQTYLALEHDPRYRTAMRHTDLVCGMAVTDGPASYRVEHGDRTFFFCSAPCRTRFLASPDLYASPYGVALGPSQ